MTHLENESKITFKILEDTQCYEKMKKVHNSSLKGGEMARFLMTILHLIRKCIQSGISVLYYLKCLKLTFKMNHEKRLQMKNKKFLKKIMHPIIFL